MLGDDRPSLHFICDATGNEITLGFGYLHGKPTLAVFNGKEENEFVLLPREVLVEALTAGWPDETGNWIEFSKN